MKITDDDIELLKLIDNHYLVTRDFVQIYTKKHEKSVYRRMKLLVDNNYLIKFDTPIKYIINADIFIIGKKGMKLINSHYKFSNKLRIKNIEHTLGLLEIELDLINIYKDELKKIYTEKELFYEIKQTSESIDEYLLAIKYEPDIIVELKSGMKIAVEYERTQKVKTRILDKAKNYTFELGTGKYNEVVYYCGTNAIYNYLSEKCIAGIYLKLV